MDYGSLISQYTRHRPACSRIRISVLVTLLLLFHGPGAVRADLPSARMPGLFVGLHVAPSTMEKGFSSTIPVEVREFRPMNQDQIDRVSHLTPEGFAWDFSQGFGQLEESESGAPCRTFLLVPFRPVRTRSRLRSSAPRTFRTTSFQQAMNGLAMSVIGPKSRNLASIFPVPFALQPARLASHVSLLAVKTVFPDALEADTGFKFDGIAPALFRGMLALRVVEVKDVEGKNHLSEFLHEIPPHSKQIEQDVDYASNLMDVDRPYLSIVNSAITSLMRERKDDLFTPAPWTGGIPNTPGKTWTIQLSSDVTADPSSNSPYFLNLHAGADPGGFVHQFGWAVPESNSRNVQVLVSALAASRYMWLQASLHRNLLLAWRWRRILTAPALPPPVTQTLLRLSEPLWEYITWKTVENQLNQAELGDRASREVLDFVDLKRTNDIISMARARAQAPEYALNLARNSYPLGQEWGSFHPLPDLVDHQLCKLLVTALDGGGGTAADSGGSGRLAQLQRKFKSGKRKQFAEATADLVAAGFTGPARTVPLGNALRKLGVHGGRAIQDPSLEPDLLWLNRALKLSTAQSGNQVLAHPLGNLSGSRIQKGIELLTVTQGVTSIEYDTPGGTPPALPDGSYFFLATSRSLPDLQSALSYPKRTYAKARNKSQRVKAAARLARAEEWSDSWWNSWSSAATPAVSSGDLTTYRYLRRSFEIDKHFQELQRIVGSATTRSVHLKELQPGASGSSISTGAVCLVLADDSDGSGMKGAGPTPNHPAHQSLLLALIAAEKLIDEQATTGTATLRKSRFYRAKLKPLLGERGELMQQVWRRFLIGGGTTTPLPPEPYEYFRSMLSAAAAVTGKDVTIR